MTTPVPLEEEEGGQIEELLQVLFLLFWLLQVFFFAAPGFFFADPGHVLKTFCPIYIETQWLSGNI